MSTELRKSGIDIIGDVSWGTHFCQFYRTAQDLLDILIPYFAAGLRNNEFCMWITSEPLGREAAERALAEALPDFERYVQKGQIEILPHTDWYLRGGTFDSPRVLDDWVKKLETARARGFDGLRLTGNTFWLEKKDWRAFTDYEAAVDGVIGRYRMLAVCTYSLDRCGANEVLDVVRNHRFALVRREAKWELVESTDSKKADAALRRLAQFPLENPNPVLRTDETGGILFANNPARDCLSALGATAAEPVPADVRSLAAQAFASGQSVQAEIRDAQNRTYWFTVVRPPEESYANIYAYDITKRKRAEQILRESEEKYRLLFENMAEGFALCELIDDARGRPIDWRILEVNDAYTRHTGIPRDKIVGRRASQVLPASVTDNLARFAEVVATQKSMEFETSAKAASRYRHVVTFPAGGRRFASIIEDITERRQAEDALRASEARLARSQEIAHLGSWELDIVQDRLIWSDEIYRIFGLQPREFGATYEAFLAAVHPGDRAAVDAAYSESLRENRDIYEIEHRIVRKDTGEVRFVHEKCEHFRDADGRIVRSVGMVHDVTERKQADALRLALAEQERLRLGAAVEQASDAVVMVDLDGRIQYVNTAFETINRRPKSEAIGREYVDFVGGDPCADEIRVAVRRGEKWHGHLTRPREGARSVELEVTVSPAQDSSGALLGGLITERDVSQETILQQEIRRAQKMEALGTLAGGITHDFNNILGAIVINTELALLELDDKSPARASLPLVLKAANRGRDLVKQIVTFSRQRERERKPVQIASTIREGLKLLRPTFPETIKVHESVLADEEAVLADPAQLHQILSNLCQNAVLAISGNPGFLEVKLDAVQVDAAMAARHPDLKPGPYVRLTVADSGCGMSRETIERIFEPFFTTRSHGEGSGLGLSVVHGIVRSYEGAISVYSEVGKGSVFNIFLPRLEGISPAPQEAPKSRAARGKERVLFVEDDKAQLLGMAKLLGRLGYRVTARSSARTALTAFKKTPDAFDLVITDQTMPLMSGVELARAIMKVRTDIPIILCTGFSEKVNGETVGHYGIRAFIMKPFTAQEISGLIRKVLEGRSLDRAEE
ncbi:MAG: MEDS domain-containing protein [Candidatus Aminicenantales bacterium]